MIKAKRRKAQTSIEFMFLLGFMFVVFIVFFAVIQEKTVDLNSRKEMVALKEVDTLIKAEVRNANHFHDGYTRDFELPKRIYGKPYQIELSSDGWEIYLNMTGHAHINFLDDKVYFIELVPGKNVLCKKEGNVHINNCSGTFKKPWH